jgi:SAM-dependent methyltransferase
MAQPARPYEGLAAIYDHVMRHVDYDSWADYLDELLERFGSTPASIVDIACGTGSVSLALCALGQPVTQGVDQSEPMLRVARERALLAGHDISFDVRDLRDLDGLGAFDAAVCMYDSFNYMLDLADLETALGAVHGVLNPGGVFVFDVCTERNSLRYFSDMRDSESGPGFEYQRHCYYEPTQRIQTNDFVISFDGMDSPIEEHHEQRIHTLGDIRTTIGTTDFELHGAFDGFTFGPGSEDSDRVHFALRRRGAAEHQAVRP